MKSLVLAVSIVTALAQVRPAAPPPRANTPPPVGTAAISGRVLVDDSSGQPLRRVMVTLLSGALQLPHTTMTDDAGRFRFTGLVQGSYTMSATRPAFVPAFYGGKRAGKGPGIAIAVRDGQQVANIDLRMMRGGVITGTVRSQSGQPVPGLDVQVVQVQNADGQRRMVTPIVAMAQLAGGGVTTDDRGAYRIFGLPPGEYAVQTQMRSAGGFSTASNTRQVTAAEVQWAQQAAQQSSVSAGIAGASLTTAPPAGPAVAYAPVYYPGTTVASEAAVIAIAPGEERRGVDFSTQLVPTAVISGTVHDPDGRPLQGAQISIKGTQSESDIMSLIGGDPGARSTAEGAFSLNGVKPGRYTLTARGGPAAERRAAAGSLDVMIEARMAAGGEVGGLAGLFGSSQPWWAREEITIDGRDLTNLTLRLQPGMTISGRIVYDGVSPQPADPTTMRVSFGGVPTSTSPMEIAASMLGGTNTAVTAADGTFVAKGIVPGRYRGSLGGGMLMAMFGPAGTPANNWTLKSMVWNGRDIADVPLDVKPAEDVSGVVVTLTDQVTELSGAVFDQTDRATGNFPIVVFSTDKSYWTVGSRRVRQARPASDGKFKVTGLPAGEYFVIAVTDLDPEELYSSAFLEQLSAAGAYKIRLADGQKLAQDLKLK